MVCTLLLSDVILMNSIVSELAKYVLCFVGCTLCMHECTSIYGDVAVFVMRLGRNWVMGFGIEQYRLFFDHVFAKCNIVESSWRAIERWLNLKFPLSKEPSQLLKWIELSTVVNGGLVKVVPQK
ncbi:hypothetical protein L1987_56992 [Smallanthus sonchifolius]|uniref:Uncharacterized protein n=1 Tax=Smallanthus sonchifolius TaxID=185202 RepID=A0ACB9DC92_9ASTR|nr:hypothetical protein L1987_56992 [Smallanthus sonchifolius]